MYQGQLFDYDQDGTPEAPYKDAGNGPYTHYVDNTHPNATDTNNPHGTAQTPRVNFPAVTTIVPGSVVEMHGGPYNSGGPQNNGILHLTISGTQAQPIFIRGVSAQDRPIIERTMYVRGHHIIVENIDFNKNLRPEPAVIVRAWLGDEVHHVSVRGCEAHNLYKGDTGANVTMMYPVSYEPGVFVEDVVFYNNHIHPDFLTPPAGTYENDTCGIYGQYRTNRVWIVDNYLHHIDGDCIGGGHASDYSATNYYIGRNVCHDTTENAMDFKEIENVVISENIMYNFAGGTAGQIDGGAMVIHYGPNDAPKNAWVLYNEIYNCNGTGIQVSGQTQHDVYIIGNIIHDIKNRIVAEYMFERFDEHQFILPRLIQEGYVDTAGNVDPTFSGLGAQFRGLFPAGYSEFTYIEGVLNSALNPPGPATAFRTWECRGLYMINNIFYNNDNGVNWDPSNGQLFFYNNIISNVRNNGYHLSLERSRASAEINNNLFYQPQGQATILWGGTSYNLTDFQLNTGKGQGCLEADPLFDDPANNVFSLQAGSQAIDAGVDHTVYDLFKTRFGIDIRVDYNGTTRPQGSGWDIGAYEQAGGAVNTPPVAIIQTDTTSGIEPLTVNFNASASSDSDGSIISYEWDFDNDTVIDATGVTASHTYNTQGSYTASLTVTDDQGWKGKSQTHIIVFEKEFGELPAGCYNNVFNPAKGEKALIIVELPKQAHVRLNLYNTRGNKIKELTDEEKEPGTHKYYWDGKSGNGDVVGSGLYFVHIQAGDYKKTKKIVVVK